MSAPDGDKEKKEEKGEEEKKDDKKDEKSKIQFDPNKDLWENIAKAGPQSQHGETQDVKNILILGSKKSGKSTLIQRFIRKEEQSTPKPTTALEYCHVKREEGRKTSTAHFWEIGGGTELHSLVDVVISWENIHTLIVMYVLDLSDPRTLFEFFISSQRRVHKKIDECLTRMKQKGSGTPARMLQREKKKYGPSHADIDSLQLTGVPSIIVGSKFDLFQENPHMKVMAKTLRYLAHRTGCHLVWSTTKDEKEMQKYRAMMGHIVFGLPFPEKLFNFDYARGPLLVYAGRDTYRDIGAPDTVQQVQGFQSCGDDELDKWKRSFDDVFPPRPSQKQQKDSFEQQLKEEYAERDIDTLRQQKDDELEQQRRELKKAAKPKQP